MVVQRLNRSIVMSGRRRRRSCLLFGVLLAGLFLLGRGLFRLLRFFGRFRLGRRDSLLLWRLLRNRPTGGRWRSASWGRSRTVRRVGMMTSVTGTATVAVGIVVSHVATGTGRTRHVLARWWRWSVLLMVRIVAVLAVALRMGSVPAGEIVGTWWTGVRISGVAGVGRWHSRVGLHVRRHVMAGWRRRMSLLLMVLRWYGHVRGRTVGIGATVLLLRWGWLRIGRCWGRSCDRGWD